MMRGALLGMEGAGFSDGGLLRGASHGRRLSVHPGAGLEKRLLDQVLEPAYAAHEAYETAEASQWPPVSVTFPSGETIVTTANGLQRLAR
jgi:hypothetical protein